MPARLDAAKRLGKLLGGAEAGEGGPVPAAATLALPVLMERFAGPVLLFDAGGAILSHSGGANLLATAYNDGQMGFLTDLIRRTAGDALPRQGRCEVGTADTGMAIDLILLPIQAEGASHVLALGRDTTLDRNMIGALMSSRQLFKDLVTCSTDFAWETKPDGTFGFVSPRGALGYSAHELEGRPARDLHADMNAADAVWPFDSRTPLDGVEVWLRRKDGSIACVSVACLPVQDDKGRSKGVRGIAKDVTDKKEQAAALNQAHERLKKIARLDALTGLFNRATFFEELGWRLQHLRRHGRPGALMYIDLDNFKAVNDTGGHQQGDLVLRELANRLLNGSRAGDMVARLGGDEFAVWLEDTDTEGAKSKLENMMEIGSALNAEFGVAGKPLGLSIGVVIATQDGVENMQQLLERADEAMYAAKKSGKGRAAFAKA